MTKRYVSTPIYYVNDVPHIGHAYTTIAADIWARFMRLSGHDVYFLTGTDEHGQKIDKAAQAAGISPQEFVDQKSQTFRDLFKTLDISNNDFIRTTEERHKKGVQYLWEKLIAAGHIYLGSYAGWYAVRDEAFYQESELIDGKAPTGAPVEWVEEPCYFFRLSAFQDKLMAYYEAHPDFVYPKSRFNEVKSFVSGGLKDLALSRTTFNWGVPVPNDPKHVMYVWFDALLNYMTALGFPDMTRVNEYWAETYHVVGKDILRFHAVYWPAFLMAGDLPPPKQIVAHGWWTNEGQKISKSLGNVIDPYDLLNTYGEDQMRYFLMREVPFGQDGDFNKAAMIRRVNSELANDLGNLVQRVMTQVYKNCDQKIPVCGVLTAEDKTLIDKAYGLQKVVTEDLESWAFHKALDHIWELIGEANRYVDHQAPWALKKTDIERMQTVLYVLTEVIRVTALLLQAFLPVSTHKILEMFGIKKHLRGLDQIQTSLVAGTEILAPAPLFPRVEETL